MTSLFVANNKNIIDNINDNNIENINIGFIIKPYVKVNMPNINLITDCFITSANIIQTSQITKHI